MRRLSLFITLVALPALLIADYKPVTQALVKVTTPGTRVPLSASSLKVYSLVVQARKGNAGILYLGDSSVTSQRGYQLSASEGLGTDPQYIAPSGGLEQTDLSKWYIDALTANDGVNVFYTQRQ